MTKRIPWPLLLILLLWFTSIAVAQSAVNPAELERVDLDKDKIFGVCPMPGDRHGYCNRSTARVKVMVVAKNAHADLGYYYIPSGGKIIGSGPDIIWDLADAQAGRHTLTVGLGTRDVITGKTITKTLQVEPCDVCDLPPPPCWCPTLSVKGPVGAVKAGDAFVVHGLVEAGGRKVPVRWKVSGGSILDGHLTSDLLVRTADSDSDKEIKVTLQVEGINPECACITEAIVSVPVGKRKK